MKLGILFPVAIFIIAVVFLGWFLSAAMRRRVGIMKSTIIMLVVAIVAVAGTSLAGGDRRGDIAELSYPINKLTLYTRYPPRHSRPRGIRIAEK